MNVSSKRRRFLRTLAAGTMLGAGHIAEILARGAPPGVFTQDSMRPQLPCGVMSGDITTDRAMVWSQTDRPARMIVDWGLDESLRDAKRLFGPTALEHTGYTARADLTGLPAGQQVFYRVSFLDLSDMKTMSAPATGRLRVPPATRRNVTFSFSGDEAGQGWGINREWGGYRGYEAMRKFNPDFFVHSGDQIYADGPLVPEVKLDDGAIWRNVMTQAKSKVAETLDEFRQNFAYNFLDDNKRRFASEVPFLVQWDDHEVRNNWYPGQIIGPAEKRYQVRGLSLLAAMAKQAMFEYNPLRFNPRDPEQVYRSFNYGPSLDVFMLDERSYRGPNTPNRQTVLNEESFFLGRPQLDWLKAELNASRATWKLIASDMTISIVVPDRNPDVPKGIYEAWANGEDGAPRGRELELAELFSFIKANSIKNVVWITADVHYASATYYHPIRAQFADFKPFWEFVAGPLNAGTLVQGEIDRTFGPDVRFVSIPKDLKGNRPPSDGLQFFGIGKIDGATETLTVSLHALGGKSLWSTV